ncbi:hypothetical protein TcasGA2_TC033880 [Tribolium castaneum]|uniref:Uncharacterized protein n=1 Tax=Tribolium castaneum TaxID=7070 RepID=A0A139WE16_TRICA|nr:hypothetical protein TcasGA2_TC033880 [Tribolium castaneum]
MVNGKVLVISASPSGKCSWIELLVSAHRKYFNARGLSTSVDGIPRSSRTQTLDVSSTSPESTMNGIPRSFRALILNTSSPTLNGIPRSSLHSDP